jgi:glycosyltransferase involved in cell wall biosynthesis
MQISSVGLLPYLPSRDFAMSMPNKVTEYLAAGLPILTSLTGGYLEGVLRDAGCGRFYRGGDPQDLADAVIDAAVNREQLSCERKAAEQIFRAQFDSTIVNSNIIEHLLQVQRDYHEHLLTS